MAESVINIRNSAITVETPYYARDVLANPPDNASPFAAMWPGQPATPLRTLPALARTAGVAWIGLKDESARPLGNFKALGGSYGVLRALARAIGMEDSIPPPAPPREGWPTLICASAGNHGLAVAAAAVRVGAPARIYISAGTPDTRIARIRAQGAEIVQVQGDYYDAVAAAIDAAAAGRTLLIPDTSDDPDDPVVNDVMAGYDVIAAEIAGQLGGVAPTHVFVQAGVGGLAATMASGLAARFDQAPRIVVVEPASAACVGAALSAGHVKTIDSDGATAAQMLACRRASAPALALLRRHGASAIAVDEATIAMAPRVLRAAGGPATTISGAAGFAGLLSARPGSSRAASLGLDQSSRVLFIVTEGATPGEVP